MNPVDRVIGYFFPARGLARVRAREAIRLYEGASYGRRSTAWRQRATSANVEIGKALGPLRDRARDLVRNTPHASRAIDIIVANAVGYGIRPRPTTGTDAVDKRLVEIWEEWQEQADIEGRLSFSAMQTLAMRSMIESGEIVVRMLDAQFEDVKSNVPLKLQLLESDMIDTARDGVGYRDGSITPETIKSRLGVGMREFDRRTGLWLLPAHPGEMSLGIMRPLLSTFFKTSEVLHVFKPQRPGQVRGVSWFAPMITTAREYADFMDALLVKARIEACFSGFITNSDLGPIMDGMQPAQSITSSLSTLEPGTLKELAAGQNITFASPTTTTQAEPIMLMCLMAMSSAIGTTYDQLTGDLRQANYTSLRAGKLEFRSLIQQLQNCYFIPQLCVPVWNRMIERAILVGILPPRKKGGGYTCEWVTPTWEAINPKFDLESDAQSVRDGRMSFQEFTASWGTDWRKIIDDAAEFNSYADEKGVKFDTMAGAAPPPPPGFGGKQPGVDGQNGMPGMPDAPQDDQGEAPPPSSNGSGNGASSWDGLRAAMFEEAEHPREEHGKFTFKGGGSSGGAGGGKSSTAKAAAKDAKTAAAAKPAAAAAPSGFVPSPSKADAVKVEDGKHPGEGYSKDAVVRNGVIYTNDVYDAQRALFENKRVELDQPRGLSVLLEKLNEKLSEMKAAGQKTPTINLCNVTVKGMNLFCADTKGIPRIEMPQLDDEKTAGFVKYLKDKGYKITDEEQFASHLRATQNELNGEKVSGIAAAAKDKPRHQSKRIIISNDDYILDGHHGWAAKIGLDAADNILTNDTKMQISRVNISITELLKHADIFTEGKGKVGSVATFTPDAPKAEAAAQKKSLASAADVDGKAKAGITEHVQNASYKPLSGAPAGGHPGLISTAKITAIKDAKGDPEVDYIRADLAQMRKDLDLLKFNVNLFKKANAYPMRRADTKGGVEKVLRNVIDQMKANLRWLYNTTPKDVRDASALWYPGGRILIDEQAKKYGLTDTSVAAVYAAISPRKDWDENVYVADRIIDIYSTKQDEPWNDLMTDRAAKIIAKERENAAKAAEKGITQKGEVSAALRRIVGKKLSELTEIKDKAAWVRLYDEAHSIDAEGNDARYFSVIGPDGTRGPHKVNIGTGKKANAAWSGLVQIGQAIEALEAKGDRAKISALLSDRHKVRSFYNNLLDPYGGGDDVTADTHAVGAAWLMPMSGKSTAVGHSLASNPSPLPKGFVGSRGSIKIGIFGTYPIYTEAVRELAKELNIAPRALQSITWTAKRERFNETMTDKQDKDVAKVWKDYQTGKETLTGAQGRIDKIVPMRRPNWMT